MDRVINAPLEMPDDKLGNMFSLQQGLMDQWVSLGKLAPYPISVQTREGQSAIKETIRAANEEMAEAHQLFREITELLSSNKFEEDLESAMIYDYVGEVSDFLHFYLEAMIQLNIGEADIAAYYQRLITNSENFFAIDGKCTLGICLHVATILNEQTYRSTSRVLAFNGNPGYMMKNPNQVDLDNFVRGSTKYSMDMVYEQAQLMWDVSYNFSLAMNLLKNNSWKQRDEETDEQKLHEQIMLGWMALMNLLQYHGHNEESIYAVYFHKNTINNQRIKSKR